MPAPSAKDAGNAVVASTIKTPNNPGGSVVLTSSTIQQTMQGLANNWRDPKWAGNAEYDPRSRKRSGAGGVKEYSNLYRGYITQMRKEVREIPGSGGKKQRRVDFQFNPTQISLNYSINTDVFPDESRNSLDSAPILAATGQTLSWTLYFNRTYEMAQNTNLKRVGVMADVQSLEYLLGSSNGQGMAAVECMVCFGMTKSGKPIAFAGWISDLNVEFLQFTHRMVPTVAMVQIGMVRRFISPDAAAPPGPTTVSGIPGAVGDTAKGLLDIVAGAVGSVGGGGGTRTVAPSGGGGSAGGPRQQ